MRRICLLAVLLMAATQVWASYVDVVSAQAKARQFLMERAVDGRMMASPATSLELKYAAVSTTGNNDPVYYVFGNNSSFVIVAADDRAREILAYGESPMGDMNNLPENLKYWLEYYQRQMQFLQDHPTLQVERPALKAPSLSIPSVNPLLTAEWSQNGPYWNECPVFGTDTCYTGCPATSLSMVFHYWKYPQHQTPAVPAYTMPSYGVAMPELPPTVFDWNNMIDHYPRGAYSPVQASAVAHLMRYIGQVEEMDYTISGSGAYLKDILRAVYFFEYDQNARMLFKDDELGYQNYNDAQWAAFIQDELTHGRPIVYCAYDNYTGAGHAFNVDGYDATDDTYHINWGWNGRGNGFYALNAFGYDQYTFGTGQQMIIGIQPPEGYRNPRLQTYPHAIGLQCYMNQTAIATFSLKGTNLTRGVSLMIDDPDGVFSIDATSLTADEANNGRDITVTFAPALVGEYSATITCISEEADPITVTINGSAPLEIYDPVMSPANEAWVSLTSFRADWTDETPANNVASYTLEVNAKPAFTLLEEADFSDLPQEHPSNQASHATDYLPEGWSFTGTEFNLEGGCIMPRRNSVITTDDLSFKGYDKVTVEVLARSYGSWGDPSELTVSTNMASEELSLPFSYETQTVVLDCAETDRIEFKCGYYPMIKNIKIYAGDATQSVELMASESGTANDRLVENITGSKFYTVKNLTAGGTFLYKVKAVYIDGSESEWSNVEMVTLVDNGHAFELGDVNHDRVIDVSDVTALIACVLGFNDGICTTCGNVDGVGGLDVGDVTALIQMILNKN